MKKDFKIEGTSFESNRPDISNAEFYIVDGVMHITYEQSLSILGTVLETMPEYPSGYAYEDDTVHYWNEVYGGGRHYVRHSLTVTVLGLAEEESSSDQQAACPHCSPKEVHPYIAFLRET
jgi:hypothetical protein